MNQTNPTLIRVVITVVVLAMLSGLGYFFISNRKLQQENEQLIENQIDLDTEIEALNTKIGEMQSQIQDKDLAIDEKDKKIQDLTKEVNNKKYQVNKLMEAGKITKKQAEEYKARIDQMEYYIRKYQQEITQLKEENQQLKNQNQNLSDEVHKKDSLNYELKQEKFLYETKLAAAAVLKAADYKIIGLNRRDKELAPNEMKASKIEKIKICFNIIENQAANSGKRDVFIQIINSNNQIEKNIEQGSGYFTYEGKEQIYSIKTSVNYNRETINTCETYVRPEKNELSKGNYQVKIFCEGYVIGKQNFTLR